MRKLLIGVTLAALVGMALPAQAQVVNPRYVEFVVSPDHNVTEFGAPKLTNYQLRVFVPGAAAPLTTSDLGKPAVADGATVSFDRAAVFMAVPAVGVYEVTVAAIGPGGEGVATPVSFRAAARPPAAVPSQIVRP